tara:strand:+ start:3174 stop:3551 length:378 start_codon:yes stop_codon:yes gene_type:complete
MLDHINQDVRGIIWISDKPLAQIPTHFKELDYLFDGLIANKISHSVASEDQFEKNIFSGKSFDHDLIMFQFYSDDTTRIQKELTELLQLVPGKNDNAKVVILGAENTKLNEKALKNSYSLKFVRI